MGDVPMRLLAFGVLAGFLGILVYRVPRLDLALVVGLTLLLAGVDLFRAGRSGRDR